MIEDGLHLNEQGAKALIDYVRTHTYETEDRRPALTTIPTHTASAGGDHSTRRRRPAAPARPAPNSRA